MRSIRALSAAIPILWACSDSTSAKPTPATKAIQSTVWDSVARQLTQQYLPSQQAGLRQFAYLSQAQYHAAVAEQAAAGTTRLALPGVATASASATVLSYFYPANAARFDTLLRSHPDASQNPTEFAAASEVGRSAAAAIISRAQTDHFDTVWTGTVPTGPGMWHSAATPPAPPLYPLLGAMRTFFLTSGSQMRPAAPPAFGSASYDSALSEVRRYSDTRTTAQDSLAKFWAKPAGYTVVASFWNQVATGLIAQAGLDEAAAAQALARTNLGGMDAFIACHDAKYTYWLIRPSEADTHIVTSVPLPNHPSYPSNHACVSGAMARVLASIFPAQASTLDAMADSAMMSRVYGGLHYRFDGNTGLTLGRAIADQLASTAPVP